MEKAGKGEAMFSLFEAYCAIPHGSGHTAAATRFCLEQARAHGWDATSDAAGNVIIRCPATPGYEDRPGVILQGHLDMVAEKEPDCPLDMERDGLSLFTEGDWLGAHGTTLGGDDGIAVALILTLLADETVGHPALEAVFTVDEEIGMLGAAQMDMSALRGRYLLNLDSEEEGVLTVSCAGGAQVDITYPVCREMGEEAAFTLSIDGLTGGHSGAEIHRGRINADRLIAQALYAASQVTALRLLSLFGGTKDNAIPCRATATYYAADPAAAQQAMQTVLQQAQQAHAESDPAMTWAWGTAPGAPCLPVQATEQLLHLLVTLPCGVQQMSADIPGLVQTSLNLGILGTQEAAVTAVYSVRSAVGAEKDALLEQIRQTVQAHGATCHIHGAYPAWEYRRHSPLRETVCAAYRALYGADMRVEAIHAGLECGLFSDCIPGLDCVSFGPNMRDIHTTHERLSISSSVRLYDLVVEILRTLQ